MMVMNLFTCGMIQTGGSDLQNSEKADISIKISEVDENIKHEGCCKHHFR